MPDVLTGRQRILLFQGSFSIPIGYSESNGKCDFVRSGAVNIHGLDLNFQIQSVLGSYSDGTGHAHVRGGVNGFVVDDSLFGDLDFLQIWPTAWLFDSGAVPFSGAYTAAFNGTVSGTWSVAWDVAQHRSILGILPADHPQYATLQAAASVDGMALQRVLTFETLKAVSGAIVITVNVDGLAPFSFTWNETTPTPNRQPPYGLSMTGFAFNSGAGSCSFDIHATHSAQPVNYPWSQTLNSTKVITDSSPERGGPRNLRFQNGTYASSSYTTTAGGMAGTGTGFGTGGVGTINFGGGLGAIYADGLSMSPAVSYGIQGTIKNMDGTNYPHPLTVRWFCGSMIDVPANPSFSAQKIIRGTVTIGTGAGAQKEAGEIQKSTAYLLSTSLQANGDEPGDNHLPMNGPAWDSVSLAHAATTLTDGFGSGSWTGSHATVFVSAGSHTSISATADNGSAFRDFSYFNIEAYRTQRLRIRSTVGDNVALQIRINSKLWNIHTGAAGSYVNVDIDTMCPHALLVALPAQKDTRYPITAANDERTTQESWNWGVDYVQRFEVRGIPNGETIDLDSLTGVRTHHARAGVLAAYGPNGSRLAWRSGPAQEFRVRHLWGEVDGRVALDAHVGAGDGSIGAMVTWINSNFPGWTATNLQASGGLDSYFNNTLRGVYLGGMHSVDGVDQSDRDASSVTTFKAQFRFDMVQLHPGSGDPFTGEGYNQANYVYVTKHERYLRGGAWGIGTGSDGNAQAGAVMVYRKQSDQLAGGQDTTDARGFYKTGLPFARGTSVYEVVNGLTQVGSIINTPRRRQVVGGPVTALTRYLHLTRRKSDGLLFESNVTNSGIQILRFTGDGIYRIAFDAYSGTGVNSAQIAVGGDDAPWLAFEEGDTIYYSASHSQGAYWTVPTPITTGHDPVPASDERNGADYVAVHKESPDRWELWRKFGTSWLYIADIVGGPRGKAGLEIAEDPAATMWFTYDTGEGVQRMKSNSHGLFWTAE